MSLGKRRDGEFVMLQVPRVAHRSLTSFTPRSVSRETSFFLPQQFLAPTDNHPSIITRRREADSDSQPTAKSTNAQSGRRLITGGPLSALQRRDNGGGQAQCWCLATPSSLDLPDPSFPPVRFPIFPRYRTGTLQLLSYHLPHPDTTRHACIATAIHT